MKLQFNQRFPRENPRCRAGLPYDPSVVLSSCQALSPYNLYSQYLDRNHRRIIWQSINSTIMDFKE